MAMAVWTALVSGEQRTRLGLGERPSMDWRALRTRAWPLGDRLMGVGGDNTSEEAMCGGVM